ncbi:MAG: endopeptidase La [Nitrospirae bacterium]|nr:endopeptidase La [Nitrospirota bacterium]
MADHDRDAVPDNAPPAPQDPPAGKPGKERPVKNMVVLLPNAGRPLFPGAMAPFSVSDRAAALASLESYDAVLGVVQTVDPRNDRVETLADIHPVGIVARITKTLDDEAEETPEGGGAPRFREPADLTGEEPSMAVLLKGGPRCVVEEIVQTEPYLVARVRYPEEELDADDPETKALAMALMGELKHLVKKSPLFSRDMNVLSPPVPLEEAGRLADMAAVLTSARRDEMQAILDEFDIKKRLERALVLVKEELHLVGLQNTLNDRIERKVNRQQHDFFLREQLKVIRRELGLESDPKTLEVARFKKRLGEITCPPTVTRVIHEEIDKLEMIEPSSPEFNVSRNYLDWLTGLPWGIESREPLDIARARRILDRDHYGLKDVKDRIIEYLAVHKLKGGDLRGSILCLVGPPGVGKTSMGKSIAKTLGRQFFRFSLGGMRDEAEIKGHRRTYVGAMPGKIIQALKRVGTANPVIMLDEIDKLTSSYQGDPSSALLEVLDPEQNSQFLDHYLDVPFSLRDVFFIATANTLDGIPRPLLDRMEVIRLSGYIEQEKMAIAKRYLLPKQLKEHGIGPKHLKIGAHGFRAIARGWAREAGVRHMEQQIAKTCRKVATALATNPDAFTPVTITADDDLKPYLGDPLYRDEKLDTAARPGIALGLAWTARGGATLEIEAIAIPGKKGGLKHSGQLGNVMVESAGIAHSYISSRVADFSIDPEFFGDNLVHLHVPAGATPKDGPSAGITMGCALLSLATRKAIRRGLAMTGELTLTGRVLAVGGIKEKVIAARRQGIKEIILPAANERDLNELDAQIKKGIKFHPVTHFDQVAELAFRGLRKKA